MGNAVGQHPVSYLQRVETINCTPLHDEGSLPSCLLEFPVRTACFLLALAIA